MSQKTAFILKTILFFLFIAIAVCNINLVLWTYGTSAYWQILGLFIIVLALIWPSAFREYFAGIPQPVKAAFVVFFFFITIGNFIRKSEATFPFVSWGMYTTVYTDSHIAFSDIVGVEESGNRITFDLAAEYPSVYRRLTIGFNHRLKKILDAKKQGDRLARKEREAGRQKTLPGPVRSSLKALRAYFTPKDLGNEEEIEALKDILAFLGKRYNKLNRGNPLVAVEFVQVSIPRRDLPQIHKKQQTVLRVELSGEKP